MDESYQSAESTHCRRGNSKMHGSANRYTSNYNHHCTKSVVICTDKRTNTGMHLKTFFFWLKSVVILYRCKITSSLINLGNLWCKIKGIKWPHARGQFEQRPLIWNNSVEVHWEMVHTKCLRPRANGFWKDFQFFSLKI